MCLTPPVSLVKGDILRRMSWYFKLIEAKDVAGEKYVQLVEYYPDLRKELSENPEVNLTIEPGAPDTDDAWSEPILVGEDKEDIIRQLVNILHDITAPDV